LAAPSREEAISILEHEDRRLLELTEGLSEDEMSAPSTIGGGEWSAKDVVAHVAIWEEQAIDGVADLRRGQVPKIERYLREGTEGIDRFNREAMAGVGDLSVAGVLERAEAARRTLVGIIRGMDDDEWTAKVPYEAERRKSLAHLLGSITGAPKRPFGHAVAHTPDLEAYVSSIRSKP
jgi:hypothetical protein